LNYICTEGSRLFKKSYERAMIILSNGIKKICNKYFTDLSKIVMSQSWANFS